jgi:hypothetical protein
MVGHQIMTALELRPSVEVVTREEILERVGMETRLKENRIVDLRPGQTEQKPAESASLKGG